MTLVFATCASLNPGIFIEIVGLLACNFILVGMRRGVQEIFEKNFGTCWKKCLELFLRFVDVSLGTYQYFEENFEKSITRKKVIYLHNF